MRPLLLSSALLVAAASAQALEIVHEPLVCVPAGRYARVVARSAPEGDATAAEVQFRTGPEGGWYRVRMDAADGAWRAFLPQPTGSLPRFEYRVVLFGPEASTHETAPLAVTVAAPGEDCPSDEGSATVAAGIVVQVPPGAPAVPPVPVGFSPVGASTPQEARREAPHASQGGGGLAIGAGVAGVAGAAAVAVAGERNDAIAPRVDDLSQRLPAFTFTGTVPADGATISRGRDTFGVVVTMDREPVTPLPIQFTVGLMSLVNGTRCANMAGTLEGAQRPLGLLLTGPVVPVPGALCGESFEIRALVLQLTANQRPVIQGTVPLGKALRFDP
jgi:hypothetical protein